MINFSRIPGYPLTSDTPSRVGIVCRFKADITYLKESGLVTRDILENCHFLPIDQGFIDEGSQHLHALLDIKDVPPLELIIVSPQVTLFERPWSFSLIAKCWEMLIAGGRLVVPIRRVSGGHMTINALESLIGQKGTVLADELMMSFTRPHTGNVVSSPPSVLNWYWNNYESLLFNENRNSAIYDAIVSKSLDEICDAGLIYGEYLTSYDVADTLNPCAQERQCSLTDIPVCKIDRPVDAASRISSINQQGYSVGGLRYKAAIIGYILDEFVPRQKDLHLTDVGGGYGVLAAELLMDKQTPIGSVTVNDPMVRYLIFSGYLYDGLKEELGGRFSFSLSKMQSCDFPETDVMLFIGSLLFAKSGERDAILQRAYERLRPGGLLIVHENIKRDSYMKAKEYDMMFTAEELDERLGTLGEVHHVSSTYCGKIPRAKVADNTVFRIVQKR